MSTPIISQDLQIGEDMGYQRRAWAVQRIGWALGTVVIVAAALGLLGDGPLAAAEVTTRDGALQLGYQRFDRHRSPAELSLTVAATAAREGTVRLWLDHSYLQSVSMEDIGPEPGSTEQDGDRLVYEFKVGDRATSATFTFRVLPDRVGRIEGRAGIDGGQSVRFSQFVYP